MKDENSRSTKQLCLIAGRGVYPLELAASARKQGVNTISVIAFKGETRREIERLADQVVWLRVGQLDAFLRAVAEQGAGACVMAGQIAPSNLFHARLDRRMIDLLRSLEAWNAHSIFGALCDELRALDINLLPASCFMESAMPAPGCLTRQVPTSGQINDINLGARVARISSEFEIGQTVVVKDGVIVAVEAFEGTDQAIRRAGKIAGPRTVIVKVAKRNHDMRFDIPVIGRRTVRTLARARASVLALEAGRTIILEKERVIEDANRRNIAVIAIDLQSGSPGERS